MQMNLKLQAELRCRAGQQSLVPVRFGQLGSAVDPACVYVHVFTLRSDKFQLVSLLTSLLSGHSVTEGLRGNLLL